MSEKWRKVDWSKAKVLYEDCSMMLKCECGKDGVDIGQPERKPAMLYLWLGLLPVCENRGG